MWWRMVSGIRGGVGLRVGRWFDDNVRRVNGGVVRLIFGRTIGSMVFPYGFAFPTFLICPTIRV